MISRDVMVVNETGLHARPASILVQKASQFKSEIIISRGKKEANAKSILALMTLGASKGSQLTLEAEGEDEEKAVEKLANFIEKELAEEE